MTTVVAGAGAGEAPRASEAGRYDAFISYAREDSDFVVDCLRDALRDRGQQVWLDLDIPGGAKWRDRVMRGIEACKAFIFVISPASVASEACNQEIEDAVALNKLIIPVVYRDNYVGSLPSAVADAEWVFLRDADDPRIGMDRLVEALETDLQWRDQHTRLAGRAREWVDAGRDSSYLLRGADLRDAEAWLAQQEGHREAPTREHGEYIARSRQAAGRRLYTLIGALSVGLVIAVGLAIFALVQRQAAIHQTHAAQSRALAASSLLALGDDPELSLLLARQAVREQDTSQARQALRQALASSHVRRTMTAPDSPLGWAAFTPDERQVIANGAGPAYVFDAQTGRLVRTLSSFRYKRPLLGSEVSADGSHLLLLPNIGPPVVMDVTGRIPPVKLVDASDDWFVDAAIAPDGRTAVAVTLHTSIARVFDTQTGAVLRTLPGHPGRVALSEDGKILALAAKDSVTTYDAAQGTQLAAVRTPSGQFYPDVKFSPNGSLFVVTPGEVRAWDPISGKPGPSLRGGVHPNSTAFGWALGFSRNGAWVAGVSSNGDAASVWDAQTGRLRAQILPTGTDSFSNVALSPNGDYAVTADADGVARVWSATNAALLTELRGLAGGIGSVAFASDGTRVLTADDDGTARIWDAGLGLPDSRWPVPQAANGSLRSRWALLGSATGKTVTVLDSATGRQAFSVHLPRPAWDAVLADCAPVMAVIYQNIPVELWDMTTGRSLGSLPGTDHIVRNGSGDFQRAALSADGRRLMTGTNDTLVVWDTATRRPLTRLQHHIGGDFPQSATAFSPDDRLLATVGTDGVIVLWRADDGHVIAREHAESSPGYNASVPVVPAFSPDGSLFVAAGNWDRKPGVWRTSDGQQVSTLTESFDTVAFSPNAPLIVTDRASIWDADSGRRLLTLRDPKEGLWDAAFTADGLNVIGDTIGAHEIFSCDVCGPMTRLLQLADQRITRDFTAVERDRYLR